MPIEGIGDVGTVYKASRVVNEKVASLTSKTLTSTKEKQ